MPPTSAHLNGSINLPDTETVFREASSRIPQGLRRLPDGETGERGNWIWFQLAKFAATDGLESVVEPDPEGGYRTLPKVRLTPWADPDALEWPDLGYATAYTESYAVFDRLRAEGVVPHDVRFQVQFPTPLASINAYVRPEDQGTLEPSYTRAPYADLDRLLQELPAADVAVQWDVAVEFGLLESGFEPAPGQDFAGIVRRLAECVDRVPPEIPVGLHLCYGDYQHQHFVQPESLATQVRLANAVVAAAGRPVSWLSFTVPQDRSDAAYFAPLADLAAADTELYLGLVPYHPDTQDAGAAAEQIAAIDSLLGDRPWGISTECGLGRVDRADVPSLLDRHAAFLTPSPH